MITIKKSKNGMQSRLEKQQGFTLLEILVAVLLISVLIAGGLYFTDFGSKRRSVDLTLMDKFIQSDISQALLQTYGANGNTFTNVTDAMIVDETAFRNTDINGANGTWGVVIVVGPPALPDLNSIRMSFTFTGANNNEFAADVAQRLITNAAAPIAAPLVAAVDGQNGVTVAANVVTVMFNF